MTVSPEMLQELESALKKERTFQRLWDAACAWLVIAEESQERVDLQRALELYRLASRKKEAHPPFLASFGEALLVYGSALGDPAYVREGLEILRQAISQNQNQAWFHFAVGHKLLFDLTGKREDFKQADTVFQRAIMSVPSQGALWLCWGQLFLESGWRKRSLSEIEIAVEKFTSLKMDDCEPALVAAFLGEALAIMGLFMDDLKLIHSGKDKVYGLLHQHEKYPQLLSAAGMIQLIEGLYFQEVRHFDSALDLFHKALEHNCDDFRASHGLFQANLAWGVTANDPLRLYAACDAIERVVHLRPFSSTYLVEWGAALLQIVQLESDALEQQTVCEEAIDKLRKATDQDGDHEAEYQLGVALDILGDITGVEEYFEEAIELLTKLHFRLPSNLLITFHLAMALSHYGEIAPHLESLFEAERVFKEVLERDPEDEESLCHLGYTQLLLSEHTYDENHPEVSLQHRADAERHLMRSCSLGSAEANYHLACLYSLSGILERALDYLKRADVLRALPSEEGLLHDHWIENLRETDGFARFMEERHD